jgi:hypothetical protein
MTTRPFEPLIPQTLLNFPEPQFQNSYNRYLALPVRVLREAATKSKVACALLAIAALGTLYATSGVALIPFLFIAREWARQTTHAAVLACHKTLVDEFRKIVNDANSSHQQKQDPNEQKRPT